VNVSKGIWCIGISTLGILKVLRSRNSGHFKSRISGKDLSRPFVETRGRDRATCRYIGYRGFELTEDSIIGVSKTLKSRDRIWIVHLEETRGRDLDYRGKSR
jgi:hypothetical protein